MASVAAELLVMSSVGTCAGLFRAEAVNQLLEILKIVPTMAAGVGALSRW